MPVIDASVLYPALADDGDDGRSAREALRTGGLTAPELVDLEVLSVLRRRVASGLIPPGRAGQAIADLRSIPLARAPHLPLAQRCWQLRHNLSVYDAAYVALAEVLRVPLVTADARLAAAPGLRCDVQVLS